LVAMPTETVYGLAANALDADAVRSVFRAKGRPGDNPLIVHVSSLQMLAKVLDRALAPLHLPASMRLVIRRHWPGPLTLLLPRHPSIPDAVTCGRPTVGVRLPAHPVARALIARAGLPLAAPSANTSGRPSPTRAMHVYDDLNGRIPLILDAGACQVGVESTVLDCLRRPPAILRPGGVTDADLRQLGHPTFEHVLLYKRDFTDGQLEAAPTTPGMKYRHYSPRAPVILFELHPPVNAASDQSITLETETIQRQALRARLLAEADRLHRKTGDASHLLGPWTRPDVVARRLFDGLRLLDVQPGVRWILVEGVADQGAGVAVMNRLRKAAASVI
ncbi:DHBP synthase RibB-like alpha/beta domain-containing protein, partial [Thamnocephalis sphaerospora]